MQNKEMRGLTAGETAAIPQFISISLDLTKIRIHNRPWTFLTPKTITVARGYNIYWPGAPIEAQRPIILAHLIHEIVHVWQYKVLKIGLYSPRWLDRRYRYILEPGNSFLSFGLEQQASIIEDGYLISQGHSGRRARNTPDPLIYSHILSDLRD